MKSNKRGGSNKACNWDFFLLQKKKKTVFVAGFSEINKRGGSNKACKLLLFLLIWLWLNLIWADKKASF